ncbi:MAG TPA: hypothetical protein VHG92_12430 [Afifellaceae bacterium]|nr:hypothetical protein [Afifellaceae bacterium]
MRATLRILVVIPLAYVAACLAAGGFVVLVAFGADLDAVAGVAEAAPGELMVLVLSAAAIIGAFAFVPALIAIVLAEAFGWRSLALYLLAGAAVGLAAVALLVPPERAWSDADAQLYLAAGAIAGAAYWLVAGRSAGRRNARRAA